MKVCLYARVSSEKQAEKDLSIPDQLKFMKEYAAKHGCEVVGQYVDEAQSARTANRPQFQAMISAAKQKNPPFEGILVWKLSRFARNREDSIIYKSLLRRRGIQVISISEPIDDTPAGRMLEGMVEVVDEFFSTNTAHDTMRGMVESARRGHFMGGNPPAGYKVRKVAVEGRERNTLEPDPVLSPIIQRIFRMYLSGTGAKEIAKTLNAEGLTNAQGRPWSRNTVFNILKNEVYIGTLVWGKKNRSETVNLAGFSDGPVRNKGAYEPLVTDNDFERVQQLMALRDRRMTPPRTHSSEYLLSGLLFCGRCGKALQGCAAKTSRYHYYECFTRLSQGKDVCGARMVRRDKIEGFVIEKLKSRVLTDENLRQLVELTNETILEGRGDLAKQLKAVQAQLKDVRRRLGKLYDAIETGKMDAKTLAPRIRELQQKEADLEEKRTECQLAMEAASPQVDYRQVKAAVQDLRNLLSEGAITEQKGFLRSFIRRIEVDGESVKIKYTIPLPRSNGRGNPDDGETFALSRKSKTQNPDCEVLGLTQCGSGGLLRRYS
jgi:site-specific DNA recombinase